jgi:hypothetical protein
MIDSNKIITEEYEISRVFINDLWIYEFRLKPTSYCPQGRYLKFIDDENCTVIEDCIYLGNK